MKQHIDVPAAKWWQPWAFVSLVGIVVAAWVFLLVDVARL
jgi:hypothetical protein